jgi:hypothetical protein
LISYGDPVWCGSAVMTSKSASASFADGAACNSRSRSVCAVLDAVEKPRMRAGAPACADSHATAVVDAQNATTPAKKRRFKFMPNS